MATKFRYPLPYVEGSGFAIVGGTIQLAVNQDGDAATYEIVEDPGAMLVRAYFRVQPGLDADSTTGPDDLEAEEDEGLGMTEDTAWATEEDVDA